MVGMFLVVLALILDAAEVGLHEVAVVDGVAEGDAGFLLGVGVDGEVGVVFGRAAEVVAAGVDGVFDGFAAEEGAAAGLELADDVFLGVVGVGGGGVVFVAVAAGEVERGGRGHEGERGGGERHCEEFEVRGRPSGEIGFRKAVVGDEVEGYRCKVKTG